MPQVARWQSCLYLGCSLTRMSELKIDKIRQAGA
jgi:hypothetical protein